MRDRTDRRTDGVKPVYPPQQLRCAGGIIKFLGVMIDAQLSWKCHIENTCKKISKCVGVILKARKKLNKSILLNLYYSFAYLYFIYCNHVCGNTYPTNLKKITVLQKKITRIVTCSPYRAHSKPLLVANNVLSVSEINVYVWVYSCTITVMIMCQIYSMAPFKEIVNFIIEIQCNQMIYMYDLQGLI